MDKHRYFIVHKPYNMVSQFSSSHKVNLLGDLDFDFPEGTHAIGRLDNNSEGLLLLTTNKKVTRLLFQGEQTHERVYLVQINNILKEESLELLRSGVMIRIKEGEHYFTPACNVTIVNPADIAEHLKKDESSLHKQNDWLLITLTEGKYRQVRKMVAAVRHRCRRLIRVSIEDIKLGNLRTGEVKEMNEEEFFERLKIREY